MKSLSEIAKKVKALLSFRDLFAELYPEHFNANERGNSRCPHHEDTNASFAVHKTYGKCHAGCAPPGGKASTWDVFSLWQAKYDGDFKSAVEVLAKRTGVDLPQKAKRREDLGDPVASYDYQAADGTLLFRVNRYATTDKDGNPDKTFRQCRPDGNGAWIHNLKGVRLVLFGLPELLGTAPDNPILICEGEKDVLTARRLGFVATCNPMGARKWAAQCKDHGIHEPLKDRTVWILPDNDDPGRAHADDVALSLRGFSKEVKIVELPNLPPKGDLSDFAAAIGDDKLARELIIDQASKSQEYRPEWTGPSLITFSDLMSQDLPEPRWIIRDLLPEGLCVLAGAPKIGKSWLAHGLSLSVAIGGLALGRFECSHGRVLHCALEDNPRRFRKRMSMMLGEDPAPDRAVFACEWPDFSEDSKEADGLDHIHRWLEHDGEASRLVVIDTLQKVRLEMKLSSERREIRDALRTEGRPLSPKEIAELLGGKRENIRVLLSKMLKDGEVEKAAGQSGKYTLPPEDGLYGQSWSHEGKESTHEEVQLDCL